MFFIVISIISKFIGLFNFSWTELFAYISMFWGMSMFYYSYLKQYKFGIFSGAVLFQIGSALLSLALFELYQPAKIFIPAILSIVGTSLLLANFLESTNKFTVILGFVFVIMGIILIIFRGNLTWGLFIESVYNLLKKFWLIILILVIIISLVVIDFKSEKKSQS
jgi:hypothetical protein